MNDLKKEMAKKIMVAYLESLNVPEEIIQHVVENFNKNQEDRWGYIAQAALNFIDDHWSR